MVGSNHDKLEKWPEKIISQWRHHPRLNDTVDATTSFIGATMERSNTSYLFTVVGEKKEKTNLPNHETRYGKTLT